MKNLFIFQKSVGVFAIAAACFLMLGFIVNASKSREVDGGDIGALIFLVILPLLVGIWAIKSANEKSRKARFEDRERQVLQIALAKNGKLTASELAMNSKFSLRESEEVLNEFHKNGYVLIGHADNGAIVYDFHELLSARDKGSSKNLLDL